MDKITPEERSKVMAKVKSRGNLSTELKLIVIFKIHNIKGWRRGFPLPGKPDFVFPKSRLVLFVDGCFWHGCKEHCRLPESNEEYWIKKIARNKKRDLQITKELRGKNWVVIRLWEHELTNKNYIRKVNKIKKIVQPDNAADVLPRR